MLGLPSFLAARLPCCPVGCPALFSPLLSLSSPVFVFVFSIFSIVFSVVSCVFFDFSLCSSISPCVLCVLPSVLWVLPCALRFLRCVHCVLACCLFVFSLVVFLCSPVLSFSVDTVLWDTEYDDRKGKYKACIKNMEEGVEVVKIRSGTGSITYGTYDSANCNTGYGSAGGTPDDGGDDVFIHHEQLFGNRDTVWCRWHP